MKRSLAASVACFVLAGGCIGSGSDAPSFGPAKIVTRIGGPVVLAVSADAIFVGARESGRLRRLPMGGGRASPFGAAASPAAGLRDVVYEDPALVVSYPGDGRGLQVARLTPSRSTYDGEVLARAAAADGALAVDEDGLMVAGAGRIVRLGGKEVSKGWSGPVALAVDTRNRLWAIDAGANGERARVARGRTTDRAKRHRFATFLPAGADPVAAAADETEVYVCDAATRSVLRFHIGLDDVARRRGPVDGMRCLYDIAVTEDGSIITATDTQILRYPRR